jgi:hypothetical protein
MKILTLVTLALLYSCGNNPPGNAPSPGGAGPDYTTPGGVHVSSPVEVPPEALRAIDEGIQRSIDRMPANWTHARSHRDYTVKFVAPDLINEYGEPVLLVSGVRAAGETKGYCTRNQNDCAGTFYKCGDVYLRIPHQAGQRWQLLDLLAGAVAAEAEHEEEGEAVAAKEAAPEEFCKWAWPNADIHPHRK